MAEWIVSFRIDDVLASISKNDAISDIHIAADEYIAFRKNGEILKYT